MTPPRLSCERASRSPASMEPARPDARPLSESHPLATRGCRHRASCRRAKAPRIGSRKRNHTHLTFGEREADFWRRSCRAETKKGMGDHDLGPGRHQGFYSPPAWKKRQAQRCLSSRWDGQEPPFFKAIAQAHVACDREAAPHLCHTGPHPPTSRCTLDA